MSNAENADSSRQDRLNQIIAEYLEAVQAGKAPDRQELLDRHPDLAEDLQAFFADHDKVRQLAEPMRPAEKAPSPDASVEAPTLPPREPAPDESGAEAATLPPGDTTGKSADTAPPLGTKVRYFGDYELLDEIARGGMGVVYKARQMSLNRTVALKMILAGQLAGEEDVKRFYTEAEAAANLDHPGIVPIYEVGCHEGQHYFSMGYVEGQSLAAKIAAGPLPPREAAQLTKQVCEAVAYAHREGVIHRDLKPANVLLARSDRIHAVESKSPDESWHYEPKITDFGVAKRVEAESDLTATGQVLGTPSYMPPEQAAGKPDQIKETADIYSLGAILYTLLTGRPPFQADNPIDTLMQVLEQEAVSPRQLNSKVPRDLETICLKCLEKDRKRRYGTAQELAEELRRYLGGEPIRARPISRVARLWRWCRRKPLLATASAVAVVGTICTLVALTVSLLLRNEALRQTANLLFEQGRTECVRGDAARGILWLARSLEVAADTGADDLEYSIRAQLAGWAEHVHSLQSVFTFPRVQGATPIAAISPDGQTALRSPKDGELYVHDTLTGNVAGVHVPPPRVRRAAFRADGKAVFQDMKRQFWEMGAGTPVTPASNALFDRGWRGKVLAWSPDGKTLAATGRTDFTVDLWDTQTAKLKGSPLQHEAFVLRAAFSPDGKTLLTLSAVQYDMTYWEAEEARFWSVETGEPIGGPQRYQGRLTAAAFSPDGSAILAASTDGTAQFWEVATGRAIGPPMRHPLSRRPGDTGILKSGWPIAVGFGPDGKTVLTMARDELRVWAFAPGKAKPFALLEHEGKVGAVAFSPDGTTLLTGSEDNMARLWDVATGDPVGEPFAHEGAVTSAAFSPDGTTILTGSSDNKARLWDLETGQSVGQPLVFEGSVEMVAFSEDGRTVMTGSRKGGMWVDLSFRLCHLDKGRLVPMYPQERLGTAGDLSANGKTVLLGSYSGSIRLEYATKTWREYAAKIPRTYLSKDFRRVSTANRNSELNHALHKSPARHHRPIRAVAFSPDRKRLLSGSEDKTARLWDSLTGAAVIPPLEHRDPVQAAAFSPNGRMVATASGREARIWDTATGKPIGPPLEHQRDVVAVAFSPDGGMLATASEDNIARLWRVPLPMEGNPERIALWVRAITGMELDKDGSVRVLDIAGWQQRQRLAELGGPLIGTRREHDPHSDYAWALRPLPWTRYSGSWIAEFTWDAVRCGALSLALIALIGLSLLLLYGVIRWRWKLGFLGAVCLGFAIIGYLHLAAAGRAISLRVLFGYVMFAVIGLPNAAFALAPACLLIRGRWRWVVLLVVLWLALTMAVAAALVWQDSPSLAEVHRYSGSGWYEIGLLGAYAAGVAVLAMLLLMPAARMLRGWGCRGLRRRRT